MTKKAYNSIRLVNNVLHPWVILTIMAALIACVTTSVTLERVRWTLLPLAASFLPVYVYTIVKFRRLQRMEKIDTSIRDTMRERPREILISAFVFGIPPVVLLYFLGGPGEVLMLFIAITVVMICVALLNFTFRASFHLALVTASFCALWILIGTLALVSLPLIVLAGFFRWKLGAHTAGQLVAGAILGVAVTLLVFFAFGYIG